MVDLSSDQITLKELQYVDAWPKNAPFPGVEYASETFDRMEDMYNSFLSDYNNKNFSVVFSDGEEINFEILDKNLCHMLGIDFSNLTSSYYDSFLSDVLGIRNGTFGSYKLVEKMIEKKEDVITYDSEQRNRVINYFKSRIKCSIFNKISGFENFDFSKISKRNDDDILIYTESNEAICPYFFVKLTQQDKPFGDNNGLNRYVVKSLLAPKKDDLPGYFNNGIVSIPSLLVIDDNEKMKRKYASPSEKIQLLTTYKAIMSTYGIENSDINVFGDYYAMLAQSDPIKVRKRTL